MEFKNPHRVRRGEKALCLSVLFFLLLGDLGVQYFYLGKPAYAVARIAISIALIVLIVNIPDILWVLIVARIADFIVTIITTQQVNEEIRIANGENGYR